MIQQSVCPRCNSINRIAPGRLAAAARCGRCAASLALEDPIDVDDATFARHIENTNGPVLVDVWAPWCGPCRALEPQFRDAAKVLAGEARLLKLNADTSQTVRHLGVAGVPTLLLFQDGRIVDRTAGLLPAARLVDWVRSHRPVSASTAT
jgi:thioredoxin 2